MTGHNGNKYHNQVIKKGAGLVPPNIMIREIFNKTYAVCSICGTPTNGDHKIGENYYCAEHMQKESTSEKTKTDQMLKANKEARDFLEAVE